MDLGNLTEATFVGLMTLGFVNVLTFFKPELDSKLKFGASLLFAFILTFVPAELGNVILDKAKVAIGVAFASSGLYKVATKMGGN